MNWNIGAENTATFKVYCDFWVSHQYLQGCRKCNAVVAFNNAFKERQFIGNVYQSLCTCAECGTEIIIDEYKMNDIDHFLNQN